QIDLVYLLLQVGTPVDVRDKENRTPLHSAAWQNHAKVCRVLVEQGANVNAVCSQGASALCIAAQEGHLGVCEVLLQCGANAQQVDAYGRTAYKVALKAGHNDICALLERFGGILATPPRIRHRWKQMTPTGIAKSSQQQTTQLVPAQSQKMAEHMAIQRQAKFESDQARSPRTTVEVSVAPPNAFVGQVNIGCATATTGSVVLPQGDDALGSYARPSIASMNTGPTPPPHQQHFKQQSHPQFLAHHWPAQQMAFDPNQWQPVFPQGLHFSPNPTWCHVDAGPAVYLRPPVGSNQKSLYTPPVFFAPQVAASFDPHQLHQQPAYVLSPQGFLVPAQAPYFVPAMHQHQNAPNPLPSGFHQAIGMTQVHVPQQRLTTVPNTTTAASTMEKEAVPPCTTHSQRPPSFAAAEDVGGTHHTHHQTLEQPTNLTFTASSIASPFVSEAPMSYHYSATTPTTQEDFQKPTAAERPTIQLIVNTKLGEDVINLNEVTDSEYESSVWVSRRQVTVIPAEHTGRLGKPGAALKKVTKANRHGTMPEGHHHGSKVKAVIQGAWKGARRKKTAPGASKSSTIPVRDKKGEKQSQPESHI
uniref:ANK_REP_REGION domain-containing protein n=1 Tax=Mesocestoides corti TaxID=53468 RepID=A0A5K3FM83_MESCO